MASIGRIVHFDIDLSLPLKQVHAAPMIEGDRLADVIEITLNNRGKAVDPAGLTAVANAELSGQDGVTVRNPGTVSGGKITIPLVAECYAVPGSTRITVTLTAGKTTRTVLVLTGYVEQNGTGIIIDPSGSIPSYDDLSRLVQELEAAKKAANTATSAANTAASSANTAATNANSKASAANTAAQSANTAASTANAAAAKINGMTVSASGLAASAAPTATVSETGGHKHIAFGIPKGDTGATPRLSMGTVTTGAPGTQAAAVLTGTAENPVLSLTIPQGRPGTGTGTVTSVNAVEPDAAGNVALDAADVGARPDTWMPSAAEVGAAPETYQIDLTADELAAMTTEQRAQRYAKGTRVIRETNGDTAVLLALSGDGTAQWAGGELPRNLLDNPWFTMNQRNVTTYTAKEYGVDRWKLYQSGTVKVTSAGLTLTEAKDLGQPIENDRIQTGRQLTFSVLMKDGALHQKTFALQGNQGETILGKIGQSTLTLNLIYDWGGSGKTLVALQGSGAIRACKLEYGATSTLAADSVPEYAAELAKCQRYYQKYSPNCYTFYTGTSGETAYVYIQTFPPMRVVPTVTYVGGGIDSVQLVTKSTAQFRGSSAASYVSSIQLDADL